MILLVTYIVLVIVASVADGMVEGFEFDGRKSFERKFKDINPRGFWGSLSHQNTSGWYARLNGVFDFYHVADDLRKYGYLAPFIILYYVEHGFNWPSVGYLGAFIAVSILAKRMAMAWIRK